MAHQLSALAALMQGRGLIPTSTWWLTTICNSDLMSTGIRHIEKLPKRNIKREKCKSPVFYCLKITSKTTLRYFLFLLSSLGSHSVHNWSLWCCNSLTLKPAPSSVTPNRLLLVIFTYGGSMQIQMPKCLVVPASDSGSTWNLNKIKSPAVFIPDSLRKQLLGAHHATC